MRGGPTAGDAKAGNAGVSYATRSVYGSLAESDPRIEIQERQAKEVTTKPLQLDKTEKRIREWLDDLFPPELFGFLDNRFRDATAMRMVETVRTMDRQKIN